MKGGKAFIDTNILIRSRFAQYPEHQQARALIESLLRQATELWISRQVIREFIANVTRPQAGISPISSDRIEDHVAAFEAVFHIADDDVNITRQLLALLKTYPTGGRQVHDANIVATMLVNEITTLVTINVADMQRFEAEITVIPLMMAD